MINRSLDLRNPFPISNSRHAPAEIIRSLAFPNSSVGRAADPDIWLGRVQESLTTQGIPSSRGLGVPWQFSRSWTRTNDPLINSQLLYQLSYPGPATWMRRLSARSPRSATLQPARGRHPTERPSSVRSRRRRPCLPRGAPRIQSGQGHSGARPALRPNDRTRRGLAPPPELRFNPNFESFFLRNRANTETGETAFGSWVRQVRKAQH